MDISGISSASGLHAVSGASTGAPPQTKMSNLFDSIASLDPTGSGSVSKQDFVSTMSKLMASLRSDGPAQSGSQPVDTLNASLQALNQIDPAAVPPTASPGALINVSA